MFLTNFEICTDSVLFSVLFSENSQIREISRNLGASDSTGQEETFLRKEEGDRGGRQWAGKRWQGTGRERQEAWRKRQEAGRKDY